MPHMMKHTCTTESYERMTEFINRVTNILNESLPPFSYNYIGIANRSLGDHRLGLRFVSSVFSVPRSFSPSGSAIKIFSSFGSTIIKDYFE
ncbi:unnamed protein product [Rhizophagus irregularis]|uniref:Uncharacterized protein n=1 Tax=Rhizophagus irregularis TaxID=588596 RepID=A0A916E030_9GLOM|nr:unnamed protein product [Rhizophagus irregularis]